MLKNCLRLEKYRFRRQFFLGSLLVSLILVGSTAQAGKNSAKTKKFDQPSKGQMMVEGFRSARFGMSEKEVLKAIYKDFRISKKNVERQVHPLEKTVNLGITVQDLLPQTGPSRAYYVFGYKSNRLIQVNIIWGKPVAVKPDAGEVVNLANQLRRYFAGQNFMQEGLVMNAPLGKNAIMVFRGLDKMGRMVLLLLDNPQKPGGAAQSGYCSEVILYTKSQKTGRVSNQKWRVLDRFSRFYSIDFF